MRLYRFHGTDRRRPLPDWITETSEYRNMMSASGRWFADTVEEAMWYACDHQDGVLLMVDVDDDIVEEYRVSNLDIKSGGRNIPDNPAAWSLRPEREFYLPPELAVAAVLAHEAEEAALFETRNAAPVP